MERCKTSAVIFLNVNTVFLEYGLTVKRDNLKVSKHFTVLTLWKPSIVIGDEEAEKEKKMF